MNPAKPSQSILIVDDSVAIHNLVKVHLGDEPVTLHFGSDGTAGLRMASERVPDLVLLDVDLPDVDGYDVCRRLKGDPRTMSVPVIFLTGASTPAEKIRGLDLGAVDYVTKPFDPAELCARVRAALRTKYLLDLLAQRAEIDGLTGLWNRAYLEQRLAAELSRVDRSGCSLSCAMADIDHFKKFNDQYGHTFGDDVLRAVSRCIVDTCRAEDVVCRYGGEEIVILLPDTAVSAAEALAERVRGVIADKKLSHRGQSVGVTCSFGVAEVSHPGDHAVLERADAALYEAKQAGRNRVVLAGPPAASNGRKSDGRQERSPHTPGGATRVLIVDDEPVALSALRRALTRVGYEVETAEDGDQALARIREGAFRLVVSDFEMPKLNGIELCRAVRDEDLPGYVYFILLTAHDSPQDRVRGLSAGADDFIAKPFNADELLARVRAGERVLSLETREVAIFALARLTESRDPDTGYHLERVRCYSRLIAQHLAGVAEFRNEVNPEFIRLLYLTSPLHDIGKVGLPDSVLLKPGRLSDREFEIMKSHTTIGADTLDAALKQYPGVRFLRMGRDIALTHHERYDGNGYPSGLVGMEIPLAGRIVALADVYDAITSKRVYKEALSHEVAREVIISESGKQFDPHIVEAFLAKEQEFLDIFTRFGEQEQAQESGARSQGSAVKVLAGL